MRDFHNGRVRLYCGDCRVSIRELPDNSVDSVVTDPPYALVSIVKRFGADGAAPAKSTGATGVYRRASAGFMGKRWDNGEVAFDPDFWRDVLRVVKPGGHLLAMGGTRTFHRLACAIEDAGFEIRDQLAWLYGSGFPKSHNQPGGLGTALKPALEPICLARKPLIGTVASNIEEYGTGALNIDGCRVGARERPKVTDAKHGGHAHNTYGSPSGGGKLLPDARWPANVIHDGSDEVVEAFPDGLTSGTGAVKRGTGSGYQANAYGKESRAIGTPNVEYGDSGSAARFFYTAKADADDRLGSKHPTVKPIDLMQYLVRLITPKGGLVLDCFGGTGSTAEACLREGMRCALMEREAEYQADIERRMAHAFDGEVGRSVAIAKARPAKVNPLPMFPEAAE